MIILPDLMIIRLSIASIFGFDDYNGFIDDYLAQIDDYLPLFDDYRIGECLDFWH